MWSGQIGDSAIASKPFCLKIAQQQEARSVFYESSNKESSQKEEKQASTSSGNGS